MKKIRQWTSGGFSMWEPSIYAHESIFVSLNVAYCLAVK